MSERYLEWREFKKRLNPPPNRRTGRKWVEECGVLGYVVDHPEGRYEVYINETAWEAGVRETDPVEMEKSELEALSEVI